MEHEFQAASAMELQPAGRRNGSGGEDREDRKNTGGRRSIIGRDDLEDIENTGGWMDNENIPESWEERVNTPAFWKNQQVLKNQK